MRTLRHRQVNLPKVISLVTDWARIWAPQQSGSGRIVFNHCVVLSQKGRACPALGILSSDLTLSASHAVPNSELVTVCHCHNFLHFPYLPWKCNEARSELKWAWEFCDTPEDRRRVNSELVSTLHSLEWQLWKLDPVQQVLISFLCVSLKKGMCFCSIWVVSLSVKNMELT